MTPCSCTVLAAKNSAALRASRADARRLELRVDAGGAAREAPAEAQLAFVSAVRRAALAVEALCAGRGDDGEAPAGRRAARVVADGWLDLLVPALRAPPGRLRPAQGHAAAALRRVCCAAAASPAAVLAIVSCGAVAALADCAIRRGEDAPAADAKADAACALAALARDPDAACRVAAELLAAGALAIGANGAADWTPRARAPRGAAAREAFAALLGAVGRANGSSWRAPLFALAAADAARGDAAAPAAAIVALCDAADSASGLADDDGAAAVVAPLVVAGAVDALVRALADPRTAAPVRARVEASLAAIAPRLDVVWRARVARPVVVDALRVTAASTAAAARDAVAEAETARGEAQLWATFAAAIQTKLIAGQSGCDGDAASVTDVGTTRVADVDERTVRSEPGHVRGEAQDDQHQKEGKNKPFARPPQMAHSPSDGDSASPLPLPAGAVSAAPARVNPKLKAPGARAPSDAYRDQPARCAPAPFGSLVGDYGAVPAYAAAPSPPMREDNAESEPRATSPPDDTSARESPSLGSRLALGSLRGRAPRVVVDTVALRGPAVRTASSRS